MKFRQITFQDIYSFIREEQDIIMIFSREYYEKMKDYFHPRIHYFIDNYSDEEGNLILLPPYHGCGLKNRNGTKKLIDYRNGKQCLFLLWSDENKNIHDYCPFTRFITFGKDRILFKNKGNSIFNYSTNKYDHWPDTPSRHNFKRFLQIKETYLKSDQK